MQTNTQTIKLETSQFIPPEAVLQGLLASLNHPCNCGDADANCECEEE